MTDNYHTLRIQHHAEAMRLADQAHALCLRIDKKTAGTSFAQGDRLLRVSFRATLRRQRRGDTVRLLGLDAERMQALMTGDTVTWRGRTLTIVDWLCHRGDPIYDLFGHRIWAEPILEDEAGHAVEIAPIFWQELV